jgi:TolA-binding protein
MADRNNQKNPTNREIVDLITRQHIEVTERLGAVEEQVKYTNGRVRALETRAIESDAVEKYKREQEVKQPIQQVKVEANNQWDWKTVLAILLTLATGIAAVLGVTHGSH